MERVFGIYDDKKSTGRDLNAVGSGDQFVLAQQLTISQTDPWELWEEGAVEGDKPRPPCMTGRQCMQLHLPGGLHGGCFLRSRRANRGRRAELYVYHDMEGGKNVEDLPGRCGCRLISFDGRDQYVGRQKRAAEQGMGSDWLWSLLGPRATKRSSRCRATRVLVVWYLIDGA